MGFRSCLWRFHSVQRRLPRKTGMRRTTSPRPEFLGPWPGHGFPLADFRIRPRSPKLIYPQKKTKSISLAAAKPGWLYRVAVRQALLFRRRQGRQTRRIATYASQRAEDDDTRSNPLLWLLAAEEAELVQEALQHLPTRDRELLLLKYGEDWTAKEIAVQLGVNVNTVETRLHRARGRLRQVLESRKTDDD